MFTAFAGIPAVAFAVLLPALTYGYWHSATHAWLIVLVSGVDAGSYERPRYERLQLEFLDPEQQVVATAWLDAIGELHYLDAPPGDCNALARRAHESRERAQTWRQCARDLSRWISAWAPDAVGVEIRVDACPPRRLPLTFQVYRDEWWLWWVPLPHVGGRPYTNYQLDLILHPAACQVAFR